MNDKTDLFGDFVLFSVGRIAKDWSLKLNDGLVYANDESTLGGANSVKFTLIYKKDADGNNTGEKILILDKKITAYDSSTDEFDREVAKSLKFLKPWEFDVVKAFIFESEYGSSFSLDSEKGKISVGDGGEIRIENDEELQAIGSLVVNATIYRDCNVQIDIASPYGVNWGDCEPNDSEELCSLIWAPSSELINKAIDEAEEYKNSLNGSLNLYINIINSWRTIETAELAKVWQLILSELMSDTYIWSHTRVARLALEVLEDQKLYRKIIDDAKSMVNSGTVDFVTMALCVAEELSNDLSANREEIMDLMNGAVEKASTESPDDICNIIEATANMYSGCRLGDIEFAKSAVDRVLARTSDSKMKAKIKKAAEKTLKNYL